MAFDIDKFLESVESKRKLKNKQGDQFKIDLEGPVDNSLNSLNQNLDKYSFEELKKIYDEIKKFDETLPSKFLSIEKKTGTSFSNLTENYSSKVILAFEEKSKKLKDLIDKEFKIFNEKLSNEDFNGIEGSLDKIEEYLGFFPKEMDLDLLGLKKKLFESRIALEKLKIDFKKNKLPGMKKDFFNSIREIETFILKRDLDLAESGVLNLEEKFHNIPTILKDLFSNEYYVFLKLKNDFLKLKLFERDKEVSLKEKEFFEVMERFHHYRLTKKLDDALLCYNELVSLFNSFSLSRLNKKKEFLDHLSKVYSQLQELFLKNNVELFLNSYTSSKTLSEAREYLLHVKSTNRANLKNVEILLNKLLNLNGSVRHSVEYRKYLKAFKELRNRLIEDNKVSKSNSSLKNSSAKDSAKEGLNLNNKSLPPTGDLHSNIGLGKFDRNSNGVNLEQKNLKGRKLETSTRNNSNSRPINEGAKPFKNASSFKDLSHFHPNFNKINGIDLSSSKLNNGSEGNVLNGDIKSDKSTNSDDKLREEITNIISSSRNSRIRNEVLSLLNTITKDMSSDSAKLKFRKVLFYIDFLHIPTEVKEDLKSNLRKLFNMGD